MVLFTIGAQVLDTLLIKSTIFAAETALSVASWSAKSAIGWWLPSTVMVTEEERLRIELNGLRDELHRLEERLEQTIQHDGDEYLVV